MAAGVQSGMDGSINVLFEGNIAVVTLNCGQNRLNSLFIDKYHKALDKVERNENVQAMITMSTGKFFSNGLDLDWLSTTDRKSAMEFNRVQFPDILLRLLTFPVPTIAAINGHAFAGGLLVALCHDYRIMRTGRGWVSMNEVRINLLFTEFLTAILRTRLLGGQIYHETVVMGKVYTAAEAQEAGIVNETCEENKLMRSAFQMANNVLAKGAYNREALQNMKKQMFQHLIDLQIKQKAEHESDTQSKL